MNRFNSVKLCDEIIVGVAQSEDIFFEKERKAINFLAEIWDDVDRIFGTDMKNRDDCWVDMYINYYGPQSLEVIVIASGVTYEERLLFVPTKEEKDYLEDLLLRYIEYQGETFEGLMGLS